jgi:hypothetical protein
MEQPDGDDQTDEGAGLEAEEAVDEELDAPETGLGALGQLGAAVVVVALLLALFLGGSALFRRLFG